MPTPQKEDVKINQNRQNNMPSVINHLVHNLPPLPACELTDRQDDITLPRLIEALQNRYNIRQKMTDEYRTAADMMKSMLQEMDSSLIAKDNFIHEQNNKLVENDKKIQRNKAEIERLEKRTGIQEHNIGILHKTTEIYEGDKHSLQQELKTIEQRLQKELSDKRSMEQRMHDVVKKTQRKWEKECDRRVNVMQMEMQNKLWAKEEKLKQLKAIVTESNPESTLSDPDPPPLPPKTLFREEHLPCPVGPPHVRQGPDSPSGDDEVESNPRPASPLPSSSGSLSVTSCISSWEQRAAQDSRQDYYSLRTPAMRTQSPAGNSASRSRRRAMCLKREQAEANSPTFDLELMGRNYRTVMPVRPLHRRSCSAGGEKWVDHKPPSTIDLGTVLQPVIPNAIQVSSPNKKALSKCDRYALTHQEVASDGEIKTKLIKGDVMKTRGGGQAVQFTDVETLKQELQELTTVLRRRKP